MNTEVLDKVKKLISNELGVVEAEITLQSHLQEDLNADPLSVADLIVKIEEEFSVTIPEQDSSRFASVNDIVDFISEQRGEI